jgi:hypothetical protein
MHLSSLSLSPRNSISVKIPGQSVGSTLYHQLLPLPPVKLPVVLATKATRRFELILCTGGGYYAFYTALLISKMF